MLGLIPIHDDNPTRRPAVVNWTLIAINVVVFLLSPISPLNLSGNPIFIFLGGAILISGLLLILAATLTAKQAAGFERVVVWEHRK